MGINLQFCRRAISLEIPAANSVSRAGDIRKAAGFDGHGAGCAPRGAGSWRRSLCAPQEAHAHAAQVIYLLGAEASLALRHGRRAETEIELVFGVGGSCGPRAALEKTMARTGNGGGPAAAISSRGARELRRDVAGQGAGKPELHGFQ